jgi:hypothetical protein
MTRSDDTDITDTLKEGARSLKNRANAFAEEHDLAGRTRAAYTVAKSYVTTTAATVENEYSNGYNRRVRGRIVKAGIGAVVTVVTVALPVVSAFYLLPGACGLYSAYQVWKGVTEIGPENKEALLRDD